MPVRSHTNCRAGRKYTYIWKIAMPISVTNIAIIDGNGSQQTLRADQNSSDSSLAFHSVLEVNGTVVSLAAPLPVGGSAASGSVPTGNPLLIGGFDGTHLRSLSSDTSGNLNVNVVSGGGGGSGGGSVGAASFATGQVAMTMSSSIICNARTGASGTGRVAVTINNPQTSSSTLYIGTTSGVTISTGYPVPPGSGQTLNTTAAVYGVLDTATATIAFVETF
jgi:hypothetical protein